LRARLNESSTRQSSATRRSLLIGALDELQELAGHVFEQRLVGQPLACEAMHGLRALVDVALRIQVAVEHAAGQPAVEQLHAADLDDAVIMLDFEAGGFRVEDDLTHQRAGA